VGLSCWLPVLGVVVAVAVLLFIYIRVKGGIEFQGGFLLMIWGD
jgi:preprotein translocase subunit SecF